jgi:hypothetical protein
MHKRSSLVCQHLENISREALEKYQDVIRQYVRHRQGVYALYRRRKLYYVGLAKDLRWRLKQHLRDHHGHSWDRFSIYLTIGDQHLREMECLILRIVKPTGNKVLGNFNNSENLRRRLTRDIKLIQRTELRAIIGRASEVLDLQPRSTRNGRVPVLSKLIAQPLKLRAVLRGRVFKARVRSDGSIRFNKRSYNSPSAAGSAAIGRACDGWYFWKFERAPGDWVKLNVLRN